MRDEAEQDTVTDKYFVRKLAIKDTHQQQYSVQTLNKNGQCIKEIIFTEEIAETLDIPIRVLQAALKQEAGKGDYVDQDGKTAHPYL